MNTALARYRSARDAINNNAPAELHNSVTDAFAALPLWQRVRIMLTPAWRHALLEIQIALGSRGDRSQGAGGH